MGNLLFWLGIGAPQKSAASKKVKPSRHWVISLVAGVLLAIDRNHRIIAIIEV